jgi:2Fe-2S ferredoxin
MGITMAKITYVECDGTDHSVEVEPGKSVMQGAVGNAIPGIDADCGGSCACATCHVYVDDEWAEKLGEPSPKESDMLEFAEAVHWNSRLSCQIPVTPDLEGLIVRMPARQR